MSSYSSCVYIARVLTQRTENFIANFMDQHGYGKVVSVDFVINPESSRYKSAFVHFHDQRGDPTFWARISNGLICRIETDIVMPDGSQPVPTGEFWICSKAHNPIPRTNMNIHQVVATCSNHERVIVEHANTIRKQAHTIQEQTETIQRLEQTVQGMHDVLYQIVGGIYAQDTQAFMISSHWARLFPHEKKLQEAAEQEVVTQEHNIWPTTRQGDEHQQRIELLEKQVQILSQNMLPPPVYVHPINHEDLNNLIPHCAGKTETSMDKTDNV
jgi:hypothetical protein